MSSAARISAELLLSAAADEESLACSLASSPEEEALFLL
jgi:hypothetical protein